MVDKVKFYWADNLKFFAIIAVVMLHGSSGFSSGTPNDYWFANSAWWQGNILNSLTRWCVPIFVMISGYFLLNNNDGLNVFLKKRLLKILIPVVFWSALYSLYRVNGLIISGDYRSAIDSIIWGYKVGAPYYHFWYIAMLIPLYLLTPIIKVIVKNSNNQTIYYFLGLCFVVSIFNATTTFSYQWDYFFIYLFYYLLGGLVAIDKVKISTKISIIGIVSGIIMTILSNYYSGGDSYYYSNTSINVIVTSVGVFFLFKNAITMKMPFDGNAIFGIYFIHLFFIEALSKYTMGMVVHATSVSFYVIYTTIISFTLSYAIVYIMKKVKYLNRCV